MKEFWFNRCFREISLGNEIKKSSALRLTLIHMFFKVAQVYLT